MTLTYPAIEAARQVLWLVTGREKSRAVALLQRRDASIPAGRVDALDSVLVADTAALGESAGAD